MAAAKRIFSDEPLPQIRRADSAGIPAALARLREIADEAMSNQEHHLVLLTGSPGSGKTLVGLTFTHDYSSSEDKGHRAVFLSGNGPLVETLQHALRSKVFVQDVHRFVYDHGVKRQEAASENVLFFDEAQRAWDEEKVAEWYAKKRGVELSKSEPQIFIEIASRRSEGSVVIGLVGDGQEIHTGEESGLTQWEDAIRASEKKWVLHAPPRVAGAFSRELVAEPLLDLNQSLRSHRASAVHAWVDNILEGNIEAASRLKPDLEQAGFHAYLSSNLDECKRFLQERYQKEPTKTYGYVASSKSRNLVNYGVNTGWMSPQLVKFGRIGPWFHNRDGGDPECRQLVQVTTEFSCQGLELDSPLLCWGDDLIWRDGEWRSKVSRRAAARDPHRLRLNSYRVLLTRGRDGIVAFVPNEPALAETKRALVEAGFTPLST